MKKLVTTKAKMARYLLFAAYVRKLLNLFLKFYTEITAKRDVGPMNQQREIIYT